MEYKKIDPHVHFRDENQNYKETIKHGLELASSQGVDIVFDMPNTEKPILNKEDVERRLKLVPEEQKERYYMYIGATSEIKQLKEAVKIVKENPHVIGIKMFAGKSTGNLAILEEEHQKNIYLTLAQEKYKGVIAVHCEKEALMGNITFDPQNPITHAQSRPEEAEIESVKDQIKFAQEAEFKGILHICHISCVKSLEEINKARNSEISFKITCGITPHHLLWNENKLDNDHGLLYKMNPPLRSEENVILLRKALLKEEIDWIETDHAPHTIGEKLFFGYPSGFPSLYLYKKIVEELLPSLGMDSKAIKKITSENIIKTFEIGDNHGTE